MLMSEKSSFTLDFRSANVSLAMMDFIDANIWGLLAMPFGLFFCFWPALVAWMKAEQQQPEASEKRKDRR